MIKLDDLDFLENITSESDNISSFNDFKLLFRDLNYYFKDPNNKKLLIYSQSNSLNSLLIKYIPTFLSLSNILNDQIINANDLDNKNQLDIVGKKFKINEFEGIVHEVLTLPNSNEKYVKYESFNIRTKKNSSQVVRTERLSAFLDQRPVFNDNFDDIKPKKLIDFTKVVKSVEYKDNEINLILDPKDKYPDVNVNLENNFFSINILGSQKILSFFKNQTFKFHLKKINRHVRKNISDILKIASKDIKTSNIPHMTLFSDIENKRFLNEKAIEVLICSNLSYIKSYLYDELIEKFDNIIVFGNPKDLLDADEDTLSSIKEFCNSGFKTIDLSNYSTLSNRNFFTLSEKREIKVLTYSDNNLNKIYRLIRNLSEKYELVEINKLFLFRMVKEASIFFFRSQSNKELISEKLFNIKSLASDDEENSEISNLVKIIESYIKDSNKRFHLIDEIISKESEISFIVIAPLDSEEISKSKFYLNKKFIGKNIIVVSYKDFSNLEIDFEAVLIFSCYEEKHITSMLDFESNNKYLILNNNELVKFNKKKDFFKVAKHDLNENSLLLKENVSSTDLNIFNNFKIQDKSVDYANSLTSDLLKDFKDIHNINLFNDESYFDDNQLTLSDSKIFKESFMTTKANLLILGFSLNRYRLYCSEKHSFIIYDSDSKTLINDKVTLKKISNNYSNVKFLMPIDYDIDIRIKLSKIILGEDASIHYKNIDLWKKLLKNFLKFDYNSDYTKSNYRDFIDKLKNQNICNIKSEETLYSYINDLEKIGPFSEDALTKKFLENIIYANGLDLDYMTIFNSIKEVRRSRSMAESKLLDEILKSCNGKDIELNPIIQNNLIGEIRAFDLIHYDLDKTFNVSFNDINKLSEVNI